MVLGGYWGNPITLDDPDETQFALLSMEILGKSHSKQTE